MQLSKLEDMAYETLKNNRFIVFRIRDLCLLMGIKKTKAYNIIKSLKEKKAIKTIKNGLFYFGDADEFVLATSVHFPSYVSFWSALSYYGFTDNMPRRIFLATTRYSGEINSFKYVVIAKSRFFGYCNIGGIIMAEKEKAIVDSLMFPKYSGGIKEILKCLRNAIDEVDIKKLLDYAKRVKSKSVLRRLGYLLGSLGYEKHLVGIGKQIGKGYGLLDPSLKRKNNFNKKWLLDVNA